MKFDLSPQDHIKKEGEKYNNKDIKSDIAKNDNNYLIEFLEDRYGEFIENKKEFNVWLQKNNLEPMDDIKDSDDEIDNFDQKDNLIYVPNESIEKNGIGLAEKLLSLGSIDTKDSDLSNRKILVDQIQNFKPEEFKAFIETILYKNGSPSQGENSNIFDEYLTKEVFLSYFSILEKYKNKDLKKVFGEDFADELIEKFYELNRNKTYNGYSFDEVVYKIVTNLAHKYPDQVGDIEFWNYFSQFQGEASRIEVIIDSMLDLVKDKKCLNLAEYINSVDLEYLYAFGNEEKLMKIISSKIDFEDEKKFSDTSALLELFKAYVFGQNYDGNVNIKNMISNVINNSLKKDGSYLLRTRAEEILNILKNGDNHTQLTPFKISKDHFAFWDDKGFKLIDEKTFNRKIFLIDKFNEFKKTKFSTCSGNNMFFEYFNNKIYGEGGREIEIEDLIFNMDTLKKTDHFNDIIFDFEYLQGPFLREKIENDFNVSLSDLNLREQFNFLGFLKSKNDEEFKRIENNCKKYGVNMFRTFLSIEQGGKEMGDKILTLGEKLPEDVAQKVFAKYVEIIDNVNKITDFTRQNFNKEIEASPELIQKIEETLYLKGKQLLSGVYDDLNNQKEIDFTDISNQLDRINADTITTFAIFKQAVKNGEKLPIESIEGSVFSKKEATNISIDQRSEMSELYDRNYKDHSDREFITKVKDYFNTAFNPESNQSKNYFYTFEKDNKTRAFVRFEKQQDKSLYASALNVDEASKNFGLGEAMMDEALSREAKENILRATCLISNPSNMRYFEKGFISDHFKMVDKTNQFDLVWDEKKNTNILAKQKSIEDLVSMYLKDSYDGSIEMKKNSSLDTLHESIPVGKALVRCFMDPIDNHNWYAVYEKLPDGYGLNTSEVA